MSETEFQCLVAIPSAESFGVGIVNEQRLRSYVAAGPQRLRDTLQSLRANNWITNREFGLVRTASGDEACRDEWEFRDKLLDF